MLRGRESPIGEFELLNFFGAEPERTDPEAPWPCKRLAYEVSRGDLTSFES